jgi:hypothetical protein
VLQAREANAIFVPQDVRFDMKKLLQLFKDIWKMDDPGVLVSADAGTVRPRCLANSEQRPARTPQCLANSVTTRTRA